MSTTRRSNYTRRRQAKRLPFLLLLALVLGCALCLLPTTARAEEAAAAPPAPAEAAAPAPPADAPAAPAQSEEEKKKAEEAAAAAKAEEEKKKAEEDAKKKAEEEAKKKADEEAAAKKKAEDEEKARLEAAVTAAAAAAPDVKKMQEALEKALKDEKARLEEREKAIKEAQAKAEADLKERDAKIKALEDEKAKITKEKDDAIAAKTKEAADIKGQLDGKTKEFEEKKTLLDNTNKELTDARTKITALMIVQEDLMKQRENLHMTYEELREKYENPALQHYITKRAESFYKNNPGLQGAVNKTSELLLPTLEAGTLQYALLLNSTHSTIKSNLHPFLGEKHSHWISGFISYGLFFIPLFLTVYSLVSVRAVFKLRGCIMFCHLYFAICSAVATSMVLYLKEDPLRLFHDSNAGTYIWTQLILGVVFLAYFILQCLALCQAKVLDLWISRVVQLLAVTVIGGLYYATVFTPAMLDRGPVPMSQRGLLVFYGIPAFVFAIMLFIEKAQADDLLQMAKKDDDIKTRSSGSADDTMAVTFASAEDNLAAAAPKGIPISDAAPSRREANETHDIESPASSLLSGPSSINATSSSRSNDQQTCAGFGSVFARVVGAVVGDADSGKDQ